MRTTRHVLCRECKRMFTFEDDGTFGAAVKGTADHMMDVHPDMAPGTVKFVDLDDHALPRS